jgi:hypothetical protein
MADLVTAGQARRLTHEFRMMNVSHPEPDRPTLRQTAGVFLIAAAVVLGGFWFHGNVSLNLADEGYLWEGVRRTLRGDVPLRDFNSYDPGRYYWCAAWSGLLGDGVLGVRRSACLFRVFGLFLGLLAARRVIANPLALAGVGLVLWAWNPTFNKLFEPSLALAAVYFGVLLIERPSAGRYFLAGAVAGLTAFMGRNLGLYTLAAYLCLIPFLSFKQVGDVRLPRRLGCLLAGVVAGYAPMIVLLVRVPGFCQSFGESVKFIAHLRSTNLPLPVPWPWAVDYAKLAWLDRPVWFAVGCFYLVGVVFALVVLPVVFRTRREQVPGRALLIASVLVGLFFAHHASVRSDYEHLAQCIPPLLLGLLALPGALGLGWPTQLAVACLLGAGTLVASSTYNFYQYVTQYTYPDWRFVRYTVGRDRLWIPACQAEYLQGMKEIINQRLTPAEELFIAPCEAGLYPILDRVSPVWNTYFVYPELAERQQRMIRELQEHRVRLALVNDALAIDGKEVYRFHASNPLLWRYLTEHFQPVVEPRLSGGWQLLERKPPSP